MTPLRILPTVLRCGPCGINICEGTPCCEHVIDELQKAVEEKMAKWRVL